MSYAMASTTSIHSRGSGITATRAAARPSSLYDIRCAGGVMELRGQRITAPEEVLADQLRHACEFVASLADGRAGDEPVSDPVLPDSYEAIRWFPLPGEAQREVLQG